MMPGKHPELREHADLARFANALREFLGLAPLLQDDRWAAYRAKQKADLLEVERFGSDVLTMQRSSLHPHGGCAYRWR